MLLVGLRYHRYSCPLRFSKDRVNRCPVAQWWPYIGYLLLKVKKIVRLKLDINIEQGDEEAL